LQEVAICNQEGATVNSLNTAAAQAHIDDLLRTADHGRRARRVRSSRMGSLRHLLKL
jgi:hypothetical protein